MWCRLGELALLAYVSIIPIRMKCGSKQHRGSRRHVQKEAACHKKGSAARDETWQPFLLAVNSFVSEKKNPGRMGVSYILFIFMLICACANVKFWDNAATLPKTSFTFPPLSSRHFCRKRFLANLWCRITGLKSRVAALICHINLLTSVSVVTHNSASCDMWSMGLVYRLTLPLTQIFFISVTSNLAPLCLLHYLYCTPPPPSLPLPFWSFSPESIWSSCHRNTIICRLSASAWDAETALTFNLNGKNKCLTFVQLESLHSAPKPGLRGHQKSELPVPSVFCSLLSLLTRPCMRSQGDSYFPCILTQSAHVSLRLFRNNKWQVLCKKIC